MTAALLCAVGPCFAYVSVPLTNGDITDFTSGVANNWTSFTIGPNVPDSLLFYADSMNFRSSPYSQGISGIDYVQPSGSQYGAGLYRQVSATSGKVYMLVGFQDFFDNAYAPPP